MMDLDVVVNIPKVLIGFGVVFIMVVVVVMERKEGNGILRMVVKVVIVMEKPH